MVAARRFEFSYTRALVQCRGGGRLHSGHVRLRCTGCVGRRDRTGAGRHGRRNRQALPIRPVNGGTESLTHFLHSFLAELDLCMAICGFKDIASLKDAGCEQATDLQK
jgi:hypothetical protein